MALNSDTKMVWNCDRDEKKGKYNKLKVKYQVKSNMASS